MTISCKSSSIRDFMCNRPEVEGAEELHRVRVGDYRIIYGLDTHRSEVVIQYVRHRRDCYR